MSVLATWETPAHPAEPASAILAPFTVTEDQVHLWRAHLDQPPAVVAALAALLSPDEHARAGSFHHDLLRRRYTVGRGILRTLLGRCLGAPPQAVTLGYGRYGKPCLAGEQAQAGLEFNLAHAEALAVFGFARRRIGVDVEVIQELRDMGDVAARFFSPAEYAAWLAMGADDRQLAFYQAWTRKEAYIKALGAGLGHPLDTFSVSLLPGAPARLLDVAGDPAAPAWWTLATLDVAPNACGAVAAEGRGLRLCGWQWTADLPS